MRNPTLGDEAINVAGLRLKRDLGVFNFKSGTMYFLKPVRGKVTGGVFIGEGRFLLIPSNRNEERNIMLLSKGETGIQESFATAVFHFTDGTYEELKKAGSAVPGVSPSAFADALANVEATLRSDRVLRYNLAAHMLSDVLVDGTSGGMFYGFMAGARYSKKEVFVVDPAGVVMLNVQPEEVAFATYDESGANAAEGVLDTSVWYSGHLLSEVANGKASSTQINATFDVEKQNIDTTIEKSGTLHATSAATFASLRPGLRSVSFNLFRNFKIEKVTDENGSPLDYVFEEGNFNAMDADDPDNLTVILPRPLNVGERFTVRFTYGGKEAISAQGAGNYFPVARQDWFPASRNGDTADFELTFHIPKGMKVAATGSKVTEHTDSEHYVTTWHSEAPMSGAAFNFGRFKMMESKSSTGVTIQSYANESQPDWVHGLQIVAESNPHTGFLDSSVEAMSRRAENVNDPLLGNMDTRALMARPLAEGNAAINLYSDYFGPIPYSRVQLTQQTACNFGQASPGLVWLPICSFFDSTVRHQLGVDDVSQPYWDVVTPHELSHQWWGGAIGSNSYRDRWMSEGFADFSSALFLQLAYPNKPEKYRKFWSESLRNLQQKNQFGFRYSEVGALTMGWRLDNRRSGFQTYDTVVYYKGAFVVQMLRMMMYDSRNGDRNFKSMMHDFVNTYSNRAASTEDFKLMVERHMMPTMDLDGNKRMDWFFDQWVYGTELPRYGFTYDLLESSDGLVADLKLKQEGVSADFKMPVPVYCERADGQVVRVGTFTMKGNTSVENKVPLGKGPRPKRFMINYYYDVLTQQ